MKKKLFGMVAVLAAFTASGAWAAPAYTPDPVHSTVGFSIRHMMLANVTGAFNDYKGDIAFSPDDLAHSKFDFVIKAVSIDTRNDARDKHLRSPEFFEVEKYPDIVFKTKKVEKTGEGAYRVTGDLTMKAVTREVVLPVTVSGPVLMQGVNAIGVQTSFRVNRQDYGISFNKVLDNGGLAVANDVDVAVNIEAHQSK